MTTDYHLQRLLAAAQWQGFQRSTAAALRLDLILFRIGGPLPTGSPAVCPVCGTPATPLDQHDAAEAVKSRAGSHPIVTGHGQETVAFTLLPEIVVIVREACSTCVKGLPPLVERAETACRLLGSFAQTLIEGHQGGQRAVELSALRRMNHIVLSLFSDEVEAATKAYDLLLSALVILLGAQGSWLEYQADGETCVLSKGDPDTVAAGRAGQGNTLSVEVHGGGISGRLAVIAPADPRHAAQLLSLLAQECAIVFEIQRLFGLVKSELRRVLGAMTVGVWLIGAHGNVTFVNSTAERMVGRTALDMVGSPISSIAGPWIPALVPRMPSARVCGEVDRLNAASGVAHIDWDVTPLFDGDAIVGWLMTATDRTDFHRWREAARQGERLAVTNTLVAALAHELRNPLTAAKGLLELATRRRDPARVLEYAGLAVTEIDRVARLLNDFLLLGRPAQLTPGSLNLSDLVHEVLPLLEGDAAAAGVMLVTELDYAPQVEADTGQLRQVILNLVKNAVEAAGRGGLVAIRVTRHGDDAVLKVRDSGPGLAAEALNRVFEPFFSTKKHGTGLGLAVSQAIVRNHGGSIAAANLPAGGAEFTVALPSQPAQDLPVDVLIRVADPLLRYPIAQALRSAGVRTVLCEQASSLEDLAVLCRPQLIVVDETSLNADLAAVQQLTGTPVVAIGKAHSDNPPAHIEFLPKPVDYVSLLLTVRKRLAGGAKVLPQAADAGT